MFASRFTGEAPAVPFDPKKLIRKRTHQVVAEEETRYESDSEDSAEEQEQDEERPQKAEDNDIEMEDPAFDSSRELLKQTPKSYLNENTELEADPEYSSKHAAVFKRFTTSVKHDVVVEEKKEDEFDKAEAAELGPIPQPSLPRDTKLVRSTQKTLDWLTAPRYSNVEETKPFSGLQPPIDSQILTNLRKEFGIFEAFSVQISVIQQLLRDQQRNALSPLPQGDLLVNAATGSGKTLAYCIPIVQALMRRRVGAVRALILVPTRPLITQVYSTLLKLTKGIDLNVMVFRNDVSIKDEAEKLTAQHGIPDILISTPGRVVEHITQGHLDLSQLRYLVVDEADRLLNQSFQNWCDVLITEISRKSTANNVAAQWNLRCTKMVFSATLTTDSGKLSHLNLFNPRLIVVNNAEGLVKELYQIPQTLEEMYFKIHLSLNFYKPLVLLKFLQNPIAHFFNGSGLVFTKSNESAIRLTRLLTIVAEEFGIKKTVVSINSTLSNMEKQKIFRTFMNREIDILISTDVLARGMSLNMVDYVINYDLPLSTKEYIHRVGRTARANQQGVGLSIVVGDGEFKWFKKVVYGGAVINRNGKPVHEIPVVRERSVDYENPFLLDLSTEEKAKYEECLLRLEREVYNK